jgi:hypothetical protein
MKSRTSSDTSSFWGTGMEAFLARQQFLCFFPLPQGQGALRPIFIVWDSLRASFQLRRYHFRRYSDRMPKSRAFCRKQTISTARTARPLAPKTASPASFSDGLNSVAAVASFRGIGSPPPAPKPKRVGEHQYDRNKKSKNDIQNHHSLTSPNNLLKGAPTRA